VRAAEAGYNLVVLVVAITVLNVLVAAMLPLWSTAIRREKEEELVFRGFQYAEAIRLFHQRFQRYPNKLEELIEVKPRCIRQLWKDPMTENGKWGLIFQNGPQGQVRRQPPGDNAEQGSGEQSTEDEESDADGRPQFGPAKGDTVQIGPIVGVHSKSGKKSMLVLFGRERYDEWRFTEEILIQAMGGQRGSIEGNPAVGNPGQEGVSFNFSTRWLGRPMRFLNQSPTMPQDGTLPDGLRPGGQGRKKPPASGDSSKPR
jgi:type II secretory pathway pseudopilin PulG